VRAFAALRGSRLSATSASSVAFGKRPGPVGSANVVRAQRAVDAKSGGSVSGADGLRSRPAGNVTSDGVRPGVAHASVHRSDAVSRPVTPNTSSGTTTSAVAAFRSPSNRTSARSSVRVQRGGPSGRDAHLEERVGAVVLVRLDVEQGRAGAGRTARPPRARPPPGPA
jgi:hypothetical protein